MSDEHRETERRVRVLRLLLEAEMGDDSMICRDGGFRYSGDFVSMEMNIVEPTFLIDADDLQELLRRGFVEVIEGDTATRVTDAGRHFVAG